MNPNTIINYLFELNLGLLFFYGVYRLLLRSETQFTLKRWFLLGAMISSVLFPLITVAGGQNTFIPTLSDSIVATWLPEIVINGTGTTPTGTAPTPSGSWGFWVYVGVAALVLLWLFVRIGQMALLFRRARRYRWQTYTVAESMQVPGTFSFFHYIFVRPDETTDDEREQMLQHEAVHIQNGHSFDIIFLHVLQAVCWFNPVIWLYKKSLVQVHEFEADARAAKRMDVDRYCSLLAKVALQQNGFVLANHFTNSFTLKRIMMMKTARKKISQWKIASAILTLAVYFIVVACQDQIIQEIANSTLTQTDFPEVVKNDIAAKYQQRYPGGTFSYVEGDADEIRQKFSAHAVAKQMIVNTYSLTGKNRIGVLLVDVANLALQDQNGVYAVVEETAMPQNGMEAFYHYIATNLTYPTEARQKGIEGRVFIEFVVNEDGSISQAKPLKGIGGGCDEEALRVIANGPAWIPARQEGKIVRQRMVVPIVFSLGNSDVKSAGDPNVKTMDEMVVVGQPKKN